VIHSLLAESYAHAKIPLVDRSLFQSAATNFCRSRLRVMVAKYMDSPVAVGCFLLYKKRVVCWYAGTKRIPGIPATSQIFWEAIRQFSQEGFEVFDFAGGGWEGEAYGPGRFKAKFGGEQTNYGRYRKIYAPRMMKAAESVYSRIRDFYAPRTERILRSDLSKLVNLFRLV
jgi:lipid II:glycine glycyltransferase (peptidoglycan interpeptide bridge formation enzyme)